MTEPTQDLPSLFEDEAIPDLQDGTPQPALAEDPQELPLLGDEPVAVDRTGITVDEQIAGESLDDKLAREIVEKPEGDPASGEDRGGGDPVDVDVGTDELVPADEALAPDAEPAGRLVKPDQGAHTDTEKDLIADEVGPDTGGWSPEERAMRVEPES